MKKLLIAIAAAGSIASFLSFAPAQSRGNKMETVRGIAAFGSIVKEIQSLYVDTIDTKKIIRTGIDAMLAEIDPYTEYYPAEEIENLTSIASGEYGGIGAVIAKRAEGIYVSNPIWDAPARNAGLRHGDFILSVDSLTVDASTPVDKVSKALRGDPGTHVVVKVRRPYVEDSIRTVDILRRTITVNPMPYYGVDSTGVGYIRLTTFNEHSAPDVKKALIELKQNPSLKGLVLDLRGNGGGLLESAVSIVGLFVPKGTEVLRTRGFDPKSEKIYKTPAPPVDTQLPLAILTDGGTASSSEIVAGALQDLDRAVIVGERSFGKGLVQTSRPLPNDEMLKVTVARYYIPSGRLIQAIDYSHRNPDGTVARIPDSLTTVWHTAHGREVRDGGGITPDVAVTDSTSNRLLYNVYADLWAYDYANRFAARTTSAPDPLQWQVTDSIFNDFKDFIDPDRFKYDRLCETGIKYLRDAAKTEGYMNDSVAAQFDVLEGLLRHDLNHDLNFNRNALSDMLDSEISQRFFPESDQVRRSLHDDIDYETARDILLDPERYKSILKQ